MTRPMMNRNMRECLEMTTRGTQGQQARTVSSVAMAPEHVVAGNTQIWFSVTFSTLAPTLTIVP